MVERLETPDLFKSAALLCLGAHLEQSHKAKGSTFFILSGENLLAEDISYRTGRLRVNPLELQSRLNQLKDLIFQGK